MPLGNKHKGRAVKWRKEGEHEHSYNIGWVFLDPHGCEVRHKVDGIDVAILIYSSPPEELTYVELSELEDWETRDKYEPKTEVQS